jgi:hypothetical protein
MSEKYTSIPWNNAILCITESIKEEENDDAGEFTLSREFLYRQVMLELDFLTATEPPVTVEMLTDPQPDPPPPTEPSSDSKFSVNFIMLCKFAAINVFLNSYVNI